MHAIVAGLNHKNADLDIRSRIFFSKSRIADALNSLKDYPSVKGSVILSTCNRVEIYASVDKVENGFRDLTDFIADFHQVEKKELDHWLYKKSCNEAVEHLFRVAASLDSMLIGEYQIQGQVREAYDMALENQSTNNLINKLFQTAIAIGKKIRSDTQIGTGPTSLASVAVDLVQKNMHGNNSFNVLLIGAGEIAALAAEKLIQSRNTLITVANRNRQKASELAEKFNGKTIDFDERYTAIFNHDVIIVSTGADHFVVENDILKEVLATENKSKILIDLSVPRNIDPEIGKINHIKLYDIDSLSDIINNTFKKRSLEIHKAEDIIKNITKDYYEWYAKQTILPVMHGIKKELEALKQRTISTFKSEFNAMDVSGQLLINQMLDSHSEKLIKVIMGNLKNITEPDDLMNIAKSLKNSFTLDVSNIE